MMIGWKKAHNCVGINLVKVRQAVRDSRRSPVVVRLYQQAVRGEAGQLIDEKAFMSLRQHQDSPLIRYRAGYPPPRLN